MRLFKALFFIVIIVIVLTVGELSADDDIPSWSDAFGYSASQQTLISNTDLVVHIIDVGQGDCTLVQSSDCSILIDAGENGRGRVVASYLENIGVERLDWIIATHPHSDHMGGIDDVLYEIPVDNIMMPTLAQEDIPNYSFYSSVMSAIDATCTPVTYTKAGDVFTMGKMTLLVISPEAYEARSDLNDLSLCLLFQLGDTSYLTCGDITYEVEEELLEKDMVPDVDLLHINHHGSALSNTAEFVLTAEPKYAVISCGANNGYGHPHNSVLGMLNNMNIEYFRTDVDGTIVFSCTSAGIEVSTANRKR